MTSLGQLGLEIVVDAASKLENNGVSMFGIFIRRYPNGFLDVTVQCSPMRLTVDEVTRIFDTARDKIIASSTLAAKTSKGTQ